MKKRMVLMGLALLIVVGSVLPVRADEDAGDRYAAEGQWSAALREYRAVHRQAPYDPDLNLKLSRALIYSGDAPAALPFLERVLQLEVENLEAHYLKAQVLQSQEQWEAALTEYIHLLPSNNPVIHLNIGYIYLRQGQHERARVELEKVIALAPQGEYYARANWYLFRLEEQHDPALALRHLRIAMDQFAGWQDEYDIAVEYYRQHAPPAAVALAERLYEGTGSGAAASRLGKLYLEQGRREEGKALLREAVALDATRHADRRILAGLLFEDNAYDAAAREYEALWQELGTVADLAAAARAAAAGGRHDLAMRHWKTVLQNDAKVEYCIAAMPSALAQGDTRTARRWLEQALALAPQDQEVLRAAIALTEAAGETDRAFIYRERLLGQTWDADQAARQAEILIRRGELRKAEQLAQRLFVEGTGAEREVLGIIKFALAQHYWEQGDTAAALSQLLHARDLGYESPEVLLLLGDAYAASGDVESARQEWRKLPAQADALTRLAKVAHRRGEYQQERQLLERYYAAGGRGYAELARLAGWRAADGDPEGAVAFLEQLTSDADPLSWLMLGRYQLQAGNATAARTSLERMLRLQPGNLEAEEWLTRAYLEEKEYGRVRRLASRLIDRAPGRSYGYVAQARVAMHDGRYGAAADALRRAAQLDPDNREISFWQGQCALARRHHAEAVRFLHAARGGVERGRLAVALGQAELGCHHYLSALAAFTKASAAGAEVPPADLAAAWRGAGKKALRTGRLLAAQQRLTRAEELAATPEGNYLLGALALQSGDATVARERWLTGSQFAQPDRRAMIGLASLYATDDIEQALEVYSRLPELTAAERAYRGNLYYAGGRAAQAYRDLVRAWEQGAKRPTVAMLLAATAPDADGRAAFLQAALDLAPDSAALYCRAAEFYAAQDDAQTGLELLDRAVARGILSPELETARAIVLAKAGYDSSALEIWERLPSQADLSPGIGLARELAWQYLAAGELDAAEDYTDRAEQLGLVPAEVAQLRGTLALWRGNNAAAQTLLGDVGPALPVGLCRALAALERGDTGAALGEFQSQAGAIGQWPPQCAAAYAVLLESEQPAAALQFYERALQVAPPSILGIQGWYQRAARMAMAAHDLAEAEKLVQAGLVRFPDSAELYLVAGDVRLAEGDMHKAGVNYRRALGLNQDLGEELYVGLARIHEQENDLEAAEETYISGLQRYARSAALRRGLVELYRRDDNREKLLAQLRTFALDDPADTWREEYRKELWRELDRQSPSVAQAKLEDMVRIDPRSTEARTRLIELYLAQRDFDRGRAQVWLGTVTSPRAEQLQLLAAELSLRRGNYDRAASEFTTARAADASLGPRALPGELWARFLAGDTRSVAALLPDLEGSDDLRTRYVRGVRAALNGDMTTARRELLTVANADRHFSNALYLAGYYALLDGADAAAAPLLREYVNGHPSDRWARLQYGEALLNTGDQDGAYAVLSRLREDDHGDVAAVFVLADICKRSGRLSEAADWETRLAALVAEDRSRQRRLGAAMVEVTQISRTTSAQQNEYLRRALEQAPENPEIHYQLANNFAGESDFGQALYHVRQIPTDFSAARLMAVQQKILEGLLHRQEYNRASDLLAQMSSRPRTEPLARVYRGRILLAKNDPVAALESWDGLEAPYPGDVDLDTWRSEAVALTGTSVSVAATSPTPTRTPLPADAELEQLRTLQEQLEQAVALVPDDDQARVRLAEVYRQLGNRSAARQQLAAALRRRRTAPALAAQADLAGDEDDWGGAVTLLQEAITLQPSEFSLHRQLAVALWRVGRSAAAEQELRLVIDSQPDSDSFYLLGKIYEDQERWPAAMAMWDQALTYGYQDDFAFRLARGNALYEQGDYEDAVGVLTVAEQEAPENMWVKLKLGQAYSRQGTVDAALDRFRQAQRAPDSELKRAACGAELQLCLELGWLDEALRIVAEGVAPTNVPAEQIAALSVLLSRAGRNQEAFTYLRDLCHRPGAPDGAWVVAAIRTGTAAGEYDAALELAREYAVDAAALPAYHTALGALHAAAGRLPAARLEAGTPIASGASADALALNAIVLREQGETAAADESFARSLTLRADQPQYYFAYGKEMMQQPGNESEPFAQLERAYILQPYNVQQTKVIARDALQRGRLATARQLYRLLLAQFPEAGEQREVAGNLCVLLTRAGFYEEALALLPPTPAASAEDMLKRGTLFFSLERYDQARSAWETALQYGADSRAVTNNLGVLALQTNDVASAIDQFHAGLENTPDDPLLLANLGRAYRRAGDLVASAETLRRAVAAEPQAAAVRMELAEVYFQNARYRESRTECEEVIALTREEELRRRADRQLRELDRFLP